MSHFIKFLFIQPQATERARDHLTPRGWDKDRVELKSFYILSIFEKPNPSFTFFSFSFTAPRYMAEIKKDGYVSVKEDGIRAWIWSKRYVILREQTLTFHRNEVKPNTRFHV